MEPDPRAKVPDRERVAIPLNPVDALRALLAVDPDAPPVDDDQDEPGSEPQSGE